MARLMPVVKFKGTDSNGDPLVGGKLYTYAAGTSTPLATYTDYSEGVTNANPVVLDSNGEASVWLSRSSYKFVLKDSNGVTQWTADNVTHMIDTPDIEDGILSADTAGRAKMDDGYVNTAKLLDGVLSADTTGRAKMANGFLSADTTGRAKMANGFVNRAKLESLGQQISSSSGAIPTTFSAGVLTDITNLSVTITTSGRPVMLVVQGVSVGSYWGFDTASGTGANVRFDLYRGATTVSSGYVFGSLSSGYPTALAVPASLVCVDAVAAGTYTYKVRGWANSCRGAVLDAQLVAYEL